VCVYSGAAQLINKLNGEDFNEADEQLFEVCTINKLINQSINHHHHHYHHHHHHHHHHHNLHCMFLRQIVVVKNVKTASHVTAEFKPD